MTLLETERLSVSFHNQWAFGSQNWYDFEIIRVFFMNDVMLGSYEFVFAFMGFLIEVTWVHDLKPRQEMSARCEKWIERLKKNGEVKNGNG